MFEIRETADFFLIYPVYGRIMAKMTIDFENFMCYDEFDHIGKS